MEAKELNLSGEGPRLSRNLVSAFAVWFFGIAPKKIVEIWGNYLAAVMHYFSVPLLLRTLFAHWHRDIEGYGRGFDFNRYFRVFMMNSVSRLVGLGVRSVTIAVGLGAEAVVFFSGLVFLSFWLLAPVAIPALFVWGLGLII
ncbi:MAG: hypothetical protein HY397_03145 [Candidatus Doudnabacteria bacterium]|nr:hypothetical protein [Candidatus Doudnabacteria bacterium]